MFDCGIELLTEKEDVYAEMGMICGKLLLLCLKFCQESRSQDASDVIYVVFFVDGVLE